MSENNPASSAGAVPPKAPEVVKVQPKKETVRINLPPKPTASPTIKIPSPTPAAPPPAAAPTPAVAASATAATPAAAPIPVTPTGAKPVAAAPIAPSGRPAAARPAAAPSGVSGLDLGLGIAAVLIALGVIARLLTL